MTMQVAMVGTDGIVLASDVRHSLSPRLDGVAARFGYGGTKIHIDGSASMAVCCARDINACKHFAVRVLAELPTVQADMREEKIRNIGREIGEKLSFQRDIESLIVFADNTTRFYRFRWMSFDKEASVVAVMDAAPAGDTVHSAIFWRMRYYERLPMAKLVPLASHMIVSAGAMNPEMIEGLEIVTCDSTGFRRFTDDENREWKTKAQKREKRIGRMVLKP